MNLRLTAAALALAASGCGQGVAELLGDGGQAEDAGPGDASLRVDSGPGADAGAEVDSGHAIDAGHSIRRGVGRRFGSARRRGEPVRARGVPRRRADGRLRPERRVLRVVGHGDSRELHRRLARGEALHRGMVRRGNRRRRHAEPRRPWGLDAVSHCLGARRGGAHAGAAPAHRGVLRPEPALGLRDRPRRRFRSGGVLPCAPAGVHQVLSAGRAASSRRREPGGSGGFGLRSRLSSHGG